MPEFVSYLDAVTHTPALENATHVKGCVVCNLKIFMEEYAEGTADRFPDAIRDKLADIMRRTIPDKHPMEIDIKRGNQSCPYEFLEYLLEALTGKANFRDEITFHEVFGLDIKSKRICEDCGDVKLSDGSTAANLGTGIILDIQDPEQGLTMIEYMRQSEFTKKVELKCESQDCLDAKKKSKEHIYKRYIVHSPEILVIRLKRDGMDPETGEHIKITGQVPLEEYINLGEFTESGAPLFYQLQGVISHDGETILFGHYIASVRKPDGKTFCSINDKIIQETRAGYLEELQFPRNSEKDFEPYVLFYTKV